MGDDFNAQYVHIYPNDEAAALAILDDWTDVGLAAKLARTSE
jgi:hypothetical protein